MTAEVGVLEQLERGRARASPWAGRGSARRWPACSREPGATGAALDHLDRGRRGLGALVALRAAGTRPSACSSVVGGEHAEDDGDAGVERDAGCSPAAHSPAT